MLARAGGSQATSSGRHCSRFGRSWGRLRRCSRQVCAATAWRNGRNDARVFLNAASALAGSGISRGVREYARGSDVYELNRLDLRSLIVQNTFLAGLKRAVDDPVVRHAAGEATTK